MKLALSGWQKQPGIFSMAQTLKERMNSRLLPKSALNKAPFISAGCALLLVRVFFSEGNR